MELIKNLPEVFEEFAEQRQKSFLAVKELKEKRCSGCGILLYIFPERDCNGDGSRMCKPLLDFGRDDSGGRKGSSEESLSADQNQVMDLQRQTNVHSSISQT